MDRKILQPSTSGQKKLLSWKSSSHLKKNTEIIAQYFHHLFVHQIEVKVSGNTHLTYKWVVIRISPSSRMRVIPFTCLAWVHPGILVSILIGWVRGNTLITLSLLLSSFQKKGPNSWGRPRLVPESLAMRVGLTGFSSMISNTQNT